MDTSLQAGFYSLVRTIRESVNFNPERGIDANKNPSLGGGQYRSGGSNTK
jgi:hypothetical protein